MTDHRRIQRTLFRMQMDPDFAAAVFAGEETAGLEAEDLALLFAADPAGVAADRGDRRKGQLLGNVGSEFLLSLTAGGGIPGLLEGFLSSDEFHGAIERDGELPSAFGAYLFRRATEHGDRLFAAVLGLEIAMAHARRRERPVDPPGDGEVVLAGRAHLHEAQAGTHACALALREHVGKSAPVDTRPEIEPPSEDATEVLLILAAERASPHRRAEVEVELLAPPVAKLLKRARLPLDRAARARVARDVDASLAELGGFVESLVADGVLLAG
ncbi:MAG: hypothetical protein O7B99_00480 [Planctomycetota bacterium]|nr:hypothetical protein [Planctomycetota bacterium]